MRAASLRRSSAATPPCRRRSSPAARAPRPHVPGGANRAATPSPHRSPRRRRRARPTRRSRPPRTSPSPCRRRSTRPTSRPPSASRSACSPRDGVQHAELHLNPTEMGPVSIHISLDGSAARVDFGADVAATRQAIERGLPELASALRDAGFTLAGGGVAAHAGSGRSPAGSEGGSSGRSSLLDVHSDTVAPAAIGRGRGPRRAGGRGRRRPLRLTGARRRRRLGAKSLAYRRFASDPAFHNFPRGERAAPTGAGAAANPCPKELRCLQ